MRAFIKRHIYLLLLIVLFAVQFFFLSPKGEFPQNDDWVHTEMIKHWIEAGELRMNPYTGPFLYVPLVYGTALAKLFGFSFTLMRLSTLALMIGANLTFYALLKLVTKSPFTSFICVLTLWFNPITYHLSFTFMSDIPALFLFILALYCYYRGFCGQKIWWLAMGSVVSLLGFYTRQTNGVLLLTAGIYALYQYRSYKLTNILLAFGAPTVIGAAIYYLLITHNLLPDGQSLHLLPNIWQTLAHARSWLWYTLVYLGFFLFPLAAGYIIDQNDHRRPGPIFLMAGAMFIALIIGAATGQYFPYVLNIITIYGLGPMQGVLDGIPKLLFADETIWHIITLACAASGAWYMFTMRHYHEERTWLDSWLFLTAIIYLIPLLIFESFDRYWLPLWVIALVLLTRSLKNLRLAAPISLSILALYAIFSISQTNFYLNWNSARWQLTNAFLKEHNLKPEQIDGGYEWDGWHSYWSAQESGIKHGQQGAPWWVRYLITNNTRDYIASFSPMPQYEIVAESKVAGWNPNNKLFILKKTDDKTAKPAK